MQISEIPHNKRPNFLSQWQQSKVLSPCFFCLHMCSWRLIVNKKIIAKQDTQLQSVLQQKNPQNFLLHQEQLTDLAPSFLCPCQKFLSKKAEFLITMGAIKSFDTILFVSSCLQISEIPLTIKGRFFLSHWEQSKVLIPDFFVFICANEDSLW